MTWDKKGGPWGISTIARKTDALTKSVLLTPPPQPVSVSRGKSVLIKSHVRAGEAVVMEPCFVGKWRQWSS